MARERSVDSSHSRHSSHRRRERSRSPDRRSSRYEEDRSSSKRSRDDRDRYYDRDRDSHRRRYRDEDDRDSYRGRVDRERRRSRTPESRKRRERDYDDERSRKERRRDRHDSPRRRERERSRERGDRDRSSRDEQVDYSQPAPQEMAAPIQQEDLLPAQTNGVSHHEPAPAVIQETDEERKIRERQEKLAAWKAKRAQAASTPPPVAAAQKPSTSSKPSKLNPNIGARLGLPTKSKATAASTMMGGEDDDDDDKIAMFRPEAGEAVNGTAEPIQAHDGDESSDDELARDDATGVVERKKAAEAMQEDPQPTDSLAAPAAAEMQVDEDDELEAYMAGISKEVVRVNEADVKRGLYAPRVNSKLGLDDAKEEPGPDEETAAPDPEAELDMTSMRVEDILALAAKKVKKKDLASVDHSSIEYEPFTKAFYREPPEIANMSDEEAAGLRLQLDGIKIRGKDCPKPITKWSHCGLPAVCLDVIKDLGYEGPTPIQAQSIPAIMSGRDVIGVAKTGSGKTIAFLLPMFRHIKDQRPIVSHEGPIAMIMTPTRELAVQIHRECKPFLKALNLRAAVSYGGSPLKDNIGELKRGAELVVCTPGRMIELLTTNSGKVVNLRRITYLVLDEADRMFDLGFEPQVMKIINQIRPDRQTVLFSATFPKQMESLARKVLTKPLELTVGGRSKVAAEIDQILEVRPEESKFNRLLELLGQFSNADLDARSLIFVDRQESADNLMRELIKKGYICQSLHGGKEQVDRDQVINDFKSGTISVVIATSVAARGLDVKQLKLVVNFDVPNHLEDYVHRAGRTGRAGNTGTCVTFITPEQERYSVDIVRALEQSGAKVPEEAKAMHDRYLASLKKEGKSYSGGGGFGGKGLDKLEQERSDADRAQRVAYGEAADPNTGSLFDEDGELKPEVANTMPGISMEVEIRRGRAPEFRTPIINTPSLNSKKPLMITSSALTAAGINDAASKAHDIARNLSDSLRNKRPDLFMHDDRGMGYSGSSTADPNATEFHALIPINDYPQRARWRVTNRETMSELAHQTGASITNKGVYVPKGSSENVDVGAKLHLLVESNDEDKVRAALNAIKRLLLESAVEALEQEARESGRGSGRYTV